MSKPNVLLITVDHWPGQLLGEAGHPVVQTPTLDQLARNGTRFTRAYSECPVCIPARRSLMTGLSPRTHGDRIYKEMDPMPEAPTLAQCFRDAGYQAHAVGKLHVYPQRSRIGFDDVLTSEEGRLFTTGVMDDYDIFLGEQGYPGRQFTHGLNNNEYLTRAWHLPEDCHVTNWAASQMARQIQRKDPLRPAFWYLGFVHPHPPLAPLQAFLDLYDEEGLDAPFMGEWVREPQALPYPLQARLGGANPKGRAVMLARRAFYALCTHIDYQIRMVLGTLRDRGELDNTLIVFMSDHGDMLGDQGLWAKRVMLEGSACVPMIVSAPAGMGRVGQGVVDDRLVCLRDVMPTLLDLCGIPSPQGVEGISMFDAPRREHLYGEFGEGVDAHRMLHDGRHKLIYYPAGNRMQLFDLESDPRESSDLSDTAAYASVREGLLQRLAGELYGGDEAWVQGGRWIGCPAPKVIDKANRSYGNQRGLRWPNPR